MKKRSSPGPLCRIDDPDAALYLGHLMTYAEAALPGGSQHEWLSLCWLSAQITQDGSRYWSMTLHDLVIEGQNLGDWKISARSVSGTTRPVTLERRATLVNDGKEIIALAHPFLSEGKSREEALESLLGFSLATLVTASNGTTRRLRISDINGTRLHVTVARTDIVKKIWNNLPAYFQCFTTFFRKRAIFCFRIFQ